MSTVLWANRLEHGKVVSDESDKVMLFKHTGRLDKAASAAGIAPFSDLCDSTDIQFNLDATELPEPMTSTDELMAEQGVWVDAAQAVSRLEALLAHIQANGVRFGLLRDDHGQVVDELNESLAYAKAAAAVPAKFNFSIVM